MTQFNGQTVPNSPFAQIGAKGSAGVAIICKAVDETVNNTAVLQDDDELKFPIKANETWVSTFRVWTVGDATADISYEVTVPSGATKMTTIIGVRPADVVVTALPAPAAFGAGSLRLTLVEVTVINGATPGNVVLQWTQSVQTVADTTVKAGSSIIAYRVA